MKGVAIVSAKGGVGKTALSHLLALGAAWKNVPSYLMHTDEREPQIVQGRPYMYYDARNPETLSHLMGAAINQDGLCIIDSGGNRPDFDKWISTSVDLVIVPVPPDPEAIKVGLKHFERLSSYGTKNVYFLLNIVSSNKNEKECDFRKYFSKVPQEYVLGQVPKVAAIKALRDDDEEPFQTPPTNVNKVARDFFSLVQKELDRLEKGKKKQKVA